MQLVSQLVTWSDCIRARQTQHTFLNCRMFVCQTGNESCFLHTFGAEGKGPPGCLSAKPVTHAAIFFLCPSSQALVLCRWALHSLSHISVVWLRTDPSEKCITKLTDKPSHREMMQTQPYRAGLHISPNGFHKFSLPRLEPATPRWESHFYHEAIPTCLPTRLASKLAKPHF